MTKALQEWLAKGYRVVSLSFRTNLSEYGCTLTDRRDWRSYSARAGTLERSVELALQKAEAERKADSTR